jgi:signal transduction histidine kinase
MEIRKHILLSSAIIVAISLASLLAVGGVAIHTIMEREARPEVSTIDSDGFAVGELLENEPTREWESLQKQVEGHGYQLVVVEAGKVLYPATTTKPAEEVVEAVMDQDWSQQVQVVSAEGRTAVGVQKDGYTMVAMHAATPIDGNHRWMENTLTLFLIVGVIFIALMLLFSQLFTRWVMGRLLRPMEELTAGAKRVSQGDLSKPVRYSGDGEFAAVCSAFNQMQRHLLEEREKNAAYEQARTDLVAGISHDLRTPLTSVKGYIKGMQDGVANTPEKQKAYLDIAYQKACQMDTLLKKLFYFSRLETGKMPLDRQKTDLGEFVRCFAAEVRPELAEKSAKIFVRCIFREHPVFIDMDQMTRVLMNLMENAIKYAQTRPLELTISVYRANGKEYLFFADNGCGVPEAQLPRLFDRFWRGDAARSTGEGNGLGLYLVKYIVEAHGGRVSAANQNGLQIEIELPGDKE